MFRLHNKIEKSEIRKISSKRLQFILALRRFVTYTFLSARGVAQLGSATALGAVGRWFESSHPDHFSFCFTLAAVVQLVEHQPSKLTVAGSSPVRRSINSLVSLLSHFYITCDDTRTIFSWLCYLSGNLNLNFNIGNEVKKRIATVCVLSNETQTVAPKQIKTHLDYLFYLSGVRCQISSLYSAMVLSDENVPAIAIFTRDF